MTSSRPCSDPSIPHGTVEGYTNHGCHGDECARAWAKYMREYRRKNRLTINARRRAMRRARVMAATGEEYDFDELLAEEMRRNRLT